MNDTDDRTREAEMSFIGALMASPELLDQHAYDLTPDDFLALDGRLGFRLMMAQHEAGYVPDFGQLLRMGRDESPTFLTYLAKAKGMGIPSLLDQYASEVRGYSLQRRLRKVAEGLVSRLDAAGPDACNDAVSQARWAMASIEAAVERMSQSKGKPIFDFVNEAMDAIEESMVKKTTMGIATGFIDIDQMIGGLFRGELTTIAARPGVGKTSLGLQIARNASGRNRRSLVFSMEMTGRELAQRCLCTEAEISNQRIRSGGVTISDRDALIQAGNKLADLGMFIDDRSTLSVGELVATCKVLAASEPIDVVVVDYVQLMTPTSSLKGRTRAEQIGDMTRGLKRLAKDLDCAVIALAQVNREAAKEGWLRLHHLKESGSIEEDSNSVWFIQKTGTGRDMKVEIEVAKNRNGQTGVIPIQWEPETTKFSTAEVASMSNYEDRFDTWNQGATS